MYLQNKYTRWYFNIINNAKLRILDDYIERHHIIPKSLGGANTKDNLVCLTAREHFICHWLLTKMTEGQNKMKMCMALVMMRASHKKHQRYNTPLTSRVYAQIKEKAVEGFRAGTNKLVKEGKHNWQKLKRKGKDHLQFDHTIYDWYHAATKTRVSMTRYDLIRTYNLSDSRICEVIQGRAKSAKDWFLWSNRPIEYVWYHQETNTSVKMTQRNFIKAYNMNPNSVGNMISNNRKSKGWILQQS
jgi:5-methylcytosine-specific restriction endonuclease McrA